MGLPTTALGCPLGQAFHCGNKRWLGLGVWATVLHAALLSVTLSLSDSVSLCPLGSLSSDTPDCRGPPEPSERVERIQAARC